MYEINLVPDVKLQMIKMQKIRNLIFFICLIIVAALVGVVVILGAIKGGQDIAMSNQDKRLANMSNVVMGYEGLDEFLTIQDQLGKISQLGEQKKLLSRVFSILSVMLPGEDSQDTVEISELTVNLETSVLTFDGQANDGVDDPGIDYRVLEAFKKGVALTKYDYGRYVDANGNEIPTRCIIETGNDGKIFMENGSVYANWTIGREGCNPTRQDLYNDVDGEIRDDNETGSTGTTSQSTANTGEVVKIWRTPQFSEWYKGGYMSLNGSISGVAHFESRCIVYTGTDKGSDVRWTAENDCMLAPSGVEVRDSSNGKDANNNLVLRFSAAIQIDSTIFSFQNKHVMAIGPSGQNVTDSYVQIEGMFAERASDCDADDVSCTTNTQNTGGNQ